jgi:TonB-dependent SusC/RagA subfamily outer membrane receptor
MRNAGATFGLALVVAGGCGGSTAPPSSRPEPGNGETGAVSTVTATGRSAGTNDMSLEEFLRGQVPGLQFLPTPDGGFTLRIRGGSDAAEPLVVIDNAPVQPGQLSRVLESLNPNDIARVQVLKDVASTARYGTRGAYGVLLITTKKR